MSKILAIHLTDKPDSTGIFLEALRLCYDIEKYTLLFRISNPTDNLLATLKTIDFAQTRLIFDPVGFTTSQCTLAMWKESFGNSDFVISIPPNCVPSSDCLLFMQYCSELFSNDLEIFWVNALNECKKQVVSLELARRTINKQGIIGLWKNRWEWAKSKNKFNPSLPAFGLEQELSLNGFKEISPRETRCQLNKHARFPETDCSKSQRNYVASKEAFHEQPLVTAVMITGMHPARYVLAKVAVDCFKRQTYQNKELLIVNHGPESLFQDDTRIREIRVHRKGLQTVGDLRNIGLRHAEGRYIICWDDDDWHHPWRIHFQMIHQTGDAAVLLENRIHYSFVNGSAAYCRIKEGGLSTILHPANVDFRYPSLIRGSDVIFARHFSQRVVINNDPELYIRFYHGLNLWDEKHIMGYLAGRENRNNLQIRVNHQKMLAQVLEKYKEWKPLGAIKNNP
jgi:hypothetical protein